MSKYEDLEAFVRTIEAGSFTAASSQLGVAKSAISRRIQDLETRLGVQLITRTTRKISLTEQGRSLFERARVLLADWEEAEASVTDDQSALSGSIKIAIPLSFGISHLGPALNTFIDMHPDIKLDIDFSDRRVDLVAEGVDLAVRIGSLPDSGLIARKLAVIRVLAAASPAYLEQKGTPHTISDLQAHEELRYRLRPTTRWEYTDANGQSGFVQMNARMIASNGEFLRDAAIAGLGIVIEPSFILYEDIQAGRLIPLLPDVEWKASGAYAIYPPTRHLSKRVRTLIEHLAKHCGGATPYWDNWDTRITRDITSS